MARARRSQNNLVIAARVEANEANARLRTLERQLRRLQQTNDRSLTAGRRNFAQMRRDMSLTSAAASRLTATLAGLASVVAFRALATNIRSTIDEIVDLDNAAASVRLTFEELQALQILGLDFGASAENVVDVVRQIQTNLARARDEGSQLGETLREVGFQFQDTAFGNLEELRRVFDRLDEATQITLTGESGNFIRQLLRDTDSLVLALEELRAQGRITSEDVAGQARAARQELDRATQELEVAFRNLAIATIPLIQIFADATSAVAQFLQSIRTRRQTQDVLRENLAFIVEQIQALPASQQQQAIAIEPPGVLNTIRRFEQIVEDFGRGNVTLEETVLRLVRDFPTQLAERLESLDIQLELEPSAQRGPPAISSGTSDFDQRLEEDEEALRQHLEWWDNYLRLRDDQIAREEEELMRSLQQQEDFRRRMEAAAQRAYERELEIQRRELERREQELLDQIEDFTGPIGDSFGRFFEDILDQTDNFGNNLRSLFLNILLDIRREIIQEFISDPITDVLTGFVRGFIPGRQLGGPVQANRPFLVGERGPEIFTPTQNGQIIPSAGQGIVVNQYNSFDLSTPDQIRSEVLLQLPVLSQQVRNDITEAFGRGESLGN